VALRRIAPDGCARLLIKLESANPTGSMKDRVALAMIEAAERSGLLKPGGRVVEYTGGSTGVSLAFVCGARGYSLSLVTSDAFSIEKRRHMAALGAELTIVPSTGGGMDASLTRNRIEAARQIAGQTGAFWTDQLNNTDQLTAYHTLADEIWVQTGGRIDAFVQSAGTAACVRGVAEGLRRRKPDIRIVAVEPRESAVLSGGKSGVHKIEGVGAGFVVPLWNPSIANEIATVSTEAAIGDGASAGALGGAVRRDFNRREPRRRDCARHAARQGRDGRHHPLRLRPQVPEHAALCRRPGYPAAIAADTAPLQQIAPGAQVRAGGNICCCWSWLRSALISNWFCWVKLLCCCCRSRARLLSMIWRSARLVVGRRSIWASAAVVARAEKAAARMRARIGVS